MTENTDEILVHDPVVTGDAPPYSVGRTLREGRERLNLSISEVSNRIKFAPRQIEALEADDYRNLPEPAFVRGFVRSYARLLEMDEKFLYRAVNEGFSGGEKKRNEILQMAMLEPQLCILDETDSGLDIDALRIVADGVNALRSPDRAFIMVTHYQRLLDYIKPDFVHVLADGKIVKSGGAELALELEEKGYGWLEQA